ncbi:hypothetical protein TRFO_09373 [Tritrichomonas foetus]|uniref:Uncharacterized protein n=1 Tax=Tritrichomonas foetus TaxID=1144522 RepID=A0A1J4JHB8_9EUKA|nr:hypothetical protein TRFO_09373 [Tritrichomonas foetus]|eukprot:OHS97655.1 hypothetical protein TRFO_09373 [Tritrichomonas foetus]
MTSNTTTNTFSFNTGGAFSGGFGGASGDPFAPQGSKIATFLNDVNTPSYSNSTNSDKPLQDFEKEEEMILVHSKYANPNEKKNLIQDVKMEGVNFSRIMSDHQ